MPGPVVKFPHSRFSKRWHWLRKKTGHKRWPWVVLFIGTLLVTAFLATSYNWVLFRNYNRMLDMARSQLKTRAVLFESYPTLSLVAGSMGFLILLGVLILFFAKLLREMKLNQLQKEFLANVTHELKTPLASLELSSELLKRDTLTAEEKQELWHSHNAELKRLKDEVNHLLTASRWEQFSDEPRLEKIHLQEWLQECRQHWSKIFEGRLKIELDLSKTAVIADLDPRLLKLIARNILDNAAKFSQSFPAPLKIQLETDVSEEPSYIVWTLHFIDQGIGFDPAHASEIFKRFKRLSNARESTIPGSGLGMHLAFSAAQAMNLDLRASSEGAGKGSRFSLEGAVDG